ncbi:FadR/GntR family transcriptional regulator [Saccharopolyspora taberi]|uniref:GntR family transcriptional regulator n=1 Tax=Saccharopolyspora taberi TaxID=60895 RepID=A0ABN3VL28_9PSEU
MTQEFRHGPLVPQVEERLRELLRQERWPVGARLPNEVRLAAELGVGRSSVREAVRLLAREGLLDVRHGAGTFVAERPAEPVEVMLRRARLLEVYEVRRALEVEAARLAARRVRPEDAEALTERLRRRQELLGGTPGEFVDADLEFHREVVELSGNAVLLGLFDSVRPLLREALVDAVVHEPDLPDVSCAHADLLAALHRGDADAAIAATERNLADVMRMISEKVAEQ